MPRISQARVNEFAVARATVMGQIRGFNVTESNLAHAYNAFVSIAGYKYGRLAPHSWRGKAEGVGRSAGLAPGVGWRMVQNAAAHLLRYRMAAAQSNIRFDRARLVKSFGAGRLDGLDGCTC